MISVILRGSGFRFFCCMTSGDELEQLELGILDLERRIFETSSRIAHESSEFGFVDRLRSMEETLAEMLIRRDRLRRQRNLTN